jgi:hypothetical protein
MRGRIRVRLCVAAGLAGVIPTATAAAQQGGTDAITAETERLKAEADKINAQAELERARVAALGLPSFEGTTKLNAGAGEMEAMLLTAPAVRLAGSTIAQKVRAEPGVILLAHNEAIDFGFADLLKAEIGGLMLQFSNLGIPGSSRAHNVARATGPTGIIAAVSAAAGLFRAETEVTAATVVVSDAMLVTAVASSLQNRAILPASANGPLDKTVLEASELLQELNALAVMNEAARVRRDELAATNGGKPDDATKEKIAAIDAVRKRYDSFLARVTSPDATGAPPLARAVRLEHLAKNKWPVLRVHVERSGGSLTNTKNITTFFGADPVRVSGGLVASYVLSDPATGSVKDASIIACRTDLARLRAIQEGTVEYRLPNNARSRGSAQDNNRAQCTP